MISDKFTVRPILKRKNPEFEEEAKFHQAEKWSYIPSVSSKTEDLSFILEEIRNYVTKNRLESAISKIGALDYQNPKRMLEIETEMLSDVLLNFNENNANVLDSLAPEDINWLTERLTAEIQKQFSSIPRNH